METATGSSIYVYLSATILTCFLWYLVWAKLESSDVLNGQFLNFYLGHDQIAVLAGYTFDIQSLGPGSCTNFE